MNIRPVRYDIKRAKNIMKHMCKFFPYTAKGKKCETKNYDIISGSKTTHKMPHSTWLAKLVFSSEPQNGKSSDPQALGPAKFSNDTNDEYSSLSTQKHENIFGNINEMDRRLGPNGLLFMCCS